MIGNRTLLTMCIISTLATTACVSEDEQKIDNGADIGKVEETKSEAGQDEKTDDSTQPSKEKADEEKKGEVEKPEEKDEPKPDDKDEPKPDDKDEPKPDDKDEPKPDDKDEPKPDDKDEPKPDDEDLKNKVSTENLQPVMTVSAFETYVKTGLINKQKQAKIYDPDAYDGMVDYERNDADIDYSPMPDIGAEAPVANMPDVEVGSSDNDSDNSEVSSTNVQVAGVDELDLLKNNQDTLFFVDKSGKSPVIHIKAMSEDPAATADLSDISIEQGSYVKGLYLFDDTLLAMGSGSQKYNYYIDEAPLKSDSGIAMAEDVMPEMMPEYVRHQETIKLWAYDVSDTTTPQDNWQVEIEGNLLGSRKIADTLYLVSTFNSPYFRSPTTEEQKQQYISASEGLSIDEILPSIKINDQAKTVLVQPENCFLPDTHKENEAYQTSITTITAINLNDGQLLSSSCYTGSVNGVFATTNSVYLTSNANNNDYRWWWDEPIFIDMPDIMLMPAVAIDTNSATAVSPEVTKLVDNDSEPTIDNDVALFIDHFSTEELLKSSYTNSLVHKFALDNKQPEYRGSVAIPGGLHSRDSNVSYRMGENGEFLNIITTSNRWADNTHRLTVLAETDSEEGTSFTEVAHLPSYQAQKAIGKPNEDIYSVRFDGDRAYIVTFERTDPLYVIDLSDNTKPVIAGELEIPGYSGYLHPVDKNLLLGIGKEADNDSGRTNIEGLKLALFDVSDISKPKEITSLQIGKKGTDSAVLSDFHALTYLKGENVDRFTLPIALRDGDDIGSQSWSKYAWQHTGLYTFELTKGDSPELVKTGVMVVDKASEDQPSYSWSRTSFDRAVIQGSALHYLHDNIVHSALWDEVNDYQVSDFVLNQALWKRHHPYNYSFELLNSCEMCDNQVPVIIEVKAGEFLAAYHDQEKTLKLTQEELKGLPLTIDAVFADVAAIMANEDSTITVKYNAKYGFPERYYVDISKNPTLIDDTYFVAVSGYTKMSYYKQEEGFEYVIMD